MFLEGMMYKREDVVRLLKPFLIQNQNIYAIWEGGSAATNHLDTYSDLDIMMATDEAYIETLFKEIDCFFDEKFGILESLRMPEPSWHGFSQKFYKLDKTESWFYIDLCILPNTIQDSFTAQDRHGMSVVWKDERDFINNEPTSVQDINVLAKEAYERAVQFNFVSRLEIEKALYRNHFIDAYQSMLVFVMRHLAPLLNIEHRKAKADFGLRYADRDYSESDYALILRFFSCSKIEELKPLFGELFARYETLKEKYSLSFKR